MQVPQQPFAAAQLQVELVEVDDEMADVGVGDRRDDRGRCGRVLW